ncbi:hypothetical protein Mapa_012526 [Marchantia paleacea]|nr:hypothetical protein Mapa_012526 [Marchantia paleacea]
MHIKVTFWLTCKCKILIAVRVDAQLSTTFYAATCPGATAKVAEVVTSWITADRTLAPALLRLHFHDCFVRGCDASVLLDSVSGVQAEKDSAGNRNSLRGFELINDVRAKVEAICPGVVSCSDILALAARDAMSLHSIYSHHVDICTFLYPAGAHTVGSAHCSNLQHRLYNFSSSVQTDQSLDPTCAASLKMQCKFGDMTRMMRMDQTRWFDTWDTNYYSNVLRGRVLFQSDEALKNPQALRLVLLLNRFLSPSNTDLATSMENLGKVGVLTGTNGQIWRTCNFIN